jgi:thymidylate kinase
MESHKLIVFFGPDGSGKTTQAKLLASHFRKRGFRVRLVWIRAHHSLASILSKILVRFGYYREISTQGRSYRLFDVNLLPGLRNFWGFVEFVSVLPWILIKVKLPMLFGYIVIADRYLIDTIVSVAYYLADVTFLTGHAARILLATLSEHAVLINLNADTAVIAARRRDEKLDFDFIRFQQKAYILFAKGLGALSLDTSHKDAIDTLNLILNSMGLSGNLT